MFFDMRLPLSSVEEARHFQPRCFRTAWSGGPGSVAGQFIHVMAYLLAVIRIRPLTLILTTSG